MAVVSSYHVEPAEVLRVETVPNKNVNPASASKKARASHQPQPTVQVNVNSGFIIATDISFAIDAIQANPIGPLRSQK